MSSRRDAGPVEDGPAIAATQGRRRLSAFWYWRSAGDLFHPEHVDRVLGARSCTRSDVSDDEARASVGDHADVGSSQRFDQVRLRQVVLDRQRGRLKMASGLSCACARSVTATQPSCSSVVPYRWAWRVKAMAACPAMLWKPCSSSELAPLPAGGAKRFPAVRWFVP